MSFSFSRLSTNQRLAALAFVLGLAAIPATPTRGGAVRIAPEELAIAIERKADHVSAPDLADWIIQGRVDFRLLDLRAEAAYATYRIPGAENLPIASLPAAGLALNEKILLYGEDGVHAAQAWFLLKARGHRAVYMLDGGLEAWKNLVLYPRLADAATPEARQRNERLRSVSLHFGGTPTAGAGEGGSEPAVSAAPLPPVPAVKGSAAARPAPKKKKEGC
ncbi:MAG: rhodanese-like domain-containing protein [Acidobacteria bacterium]|nr:MAG: rhodanese-like domain-containing protein [Acidobacteriota bacterium]